MNEEDFEGFGKIPRLNRDCTITEKIDGTNAQVVVPEDDGPVLVGSRHRWITVDDVHFGLAQFVAGDEASLRLLGPGRHFGEWWGKGVGRRQYDQDRRRFSLFNTMRWNNETLPDGLDVVPVLYEGMFSTEPATTFLDVLRVFGSVAAPGFMRPEGIIVWHDAARCYFKATVEKDHEWKGKS